MSGRVEVVKADIAKTGPGKPFGGQPVFDTPGAHMGLSRLAPGAVTPWHHHGACNFFGYVVQGTVRLEFGPGGRESADISEGHFLRIPPHLVHRDVNNTDGTVLIATACVGEGPMSTTVDAPEG